MSDENLNDERPLRWVETPIGRGTINCLTLIVLLSLTQHLGYIAPGPPVTLDNISLYATYGVVIGIIMYFWTSARLKRQNKRREALRLQSARAESEDDGN
ncbi:MAG: hypothetical protein O3B74_06965 [Proteobacteria bacterium]|nr:hypothetical protein [Pseudomonadota bacterium]MDA1309150.1 hypothetical protein [Pseudomonadota bacterium]